MNLPYSDEVTAGFEHQVMTDMRVGVMYYYRTNRDQLGVRNNAVPTSAYTPFSVPVPTNPLGVTSVTVYNLRQDLASATNNIRDNQDYLDTEYNGVEFTASKRFTNRWQMVAGLTIGKNEGGLNNNTGNGQSDSNDLNDPNNLLFERGIIGNDSEIAFRLSGSYRAWGDINVSGSLIANNGYPAITTFQVTRALAATQGVTMTRATQTVPLSQRGDERYDNVKMVDLRFSRPFRLGTRRFVPQLDIFNIGNASTVVNRTNALGSSYLTPVEILAPRIIRVGFSLDF